MISEDYNEDFLSLSCTGEAQHTERWQYPMEAIREIVMNALFIGITGTLPILL